MQEEIKEEIKPDKFYDYVVKTEKEFITTGLEYLPKAFISKKKGGITVIGMRFTCSQEKEVFQLMMKKMIAMQEVDFYIMTFDVKMTDMEKGEVLDALMINKYTVNNKIASIFPYKNKKFLEDRKQIIVDRKNQKDQWDIWGEGMDDDKFNDKYQEFKRQHPDKFKECQ